MIRVHSSTSLSLIAIAATVFNGAASAATIDFSRQIRPILSENCFFCHGPDDKKREADLRLDEEASAKATHDGVTAVVPGHPEKSALIERIISTDPEEVMPPPKQHKTIPPQQVALLKEWIAQGAKWGKHWSYEKVVRPEAPTAQTKMANPVDAFLSQRLAAEGLKFSPQADPATLVRRVALDLTGLPPTLDELNHYLPGLSAEDKAPSTYAEMVDHFLGKPAYGEHWARIWLDLARYADSSGYPSDQPREIWGYRDWVVNALNSNMPFDQFTIEQLAGDLLPNPTDDQLTATAFHRNTMTQNEGGTSDEEFRVAAIIDRVNTTMAVWMGTTMACAQCHTHKFDPITQKEYFQFYAFLNQSADADRKDETPVHEFLTPALKEQRKKIEAEIASIEDRFSHPPAAFTAGQAAWEKSFSGPLTWNAARPASVSAKSGATANIAANGSITLPKPVDQETLTLDLPVTQKQLTALAIDTAPQPGFNNFVITDVKAEIIPQGTMPPPSARFVRIELPGAKKFLQLAEVQIFNGTNNIAQKGSAKQSSQYTEAEAKRAIDGNTAGDYAKGSVAHTSGNDTDPWWEVDLLSTQPIHRIVVWNRTDGNTTSRLDGYRVIALDEKRQPIWQSGPQSNAPKVSQEFQTTGQTQISFASASADFEQSGFTAASILKPKDKINQGWAIAGATDKPHTLTLTTASPVQIPPQARLRLTIEQRSAFPKHVLGNFALRLSDDERASKNLALPATVRDALAIAPAKRSPAQQQTITSHYIRNIAKEAAPDRQRLAALTKQLESSKPATVPVMQDLTGKDRRITNIQLRGNWQALGDEVTEGVPAAFNAIPAGAPMNRLTLAKWIVDRNNPLTARVKVNRLWESLFGVGIVRSSEEFGSQGDLPVHPELLDWLAAEFMDSKWDVKHVLKLLVTSKAYQQTSRATADLTERDPDNRLLARGPRFRPAGELLRDQALAVSGLLSPKMGGPAVRPLAPNMGLSTAFGRSNDWVISEGEDRHRRSLYTEVRRNSPYPSFSTFDAPNREVCTIRRGRTNTPLQAFVTLNDPVFVEANQAMARRLLAEGGATTESKLGLIFQLCLSRNPSAAEIATLTHLHDQSFTSYQADLEQAKKFATDPLGPAPEKANLADLAAWTTVANVVMNLDEFLMRR